MKSLFNDYLNLPSVEFLINYWYVHLFVLIIAISFLVFIDKFRANHNKDKSGENRDLI